MENGREYSKIKCRALNRKFHRFCNLQFSPETEFFEDVYLPEVNIQNVIPETQEFHLILRQVHAEDVLL